MPKSFLAMITPIDEGAHPEHPIAPGGPPPSIWPSPGRPAHPIVLPPTEPGKPPVVIWPSPGHPEHPIVLPPTDLPPQPVPPYPAHPIVLPPMIWPEPPEGGPPVAIWPGRPAHPIVLPPIPPVDGAHPEHPIVIPLPPEIWPSPGRPAHPIVIPPDPPNPERPIDWVVGWTEELGWVVVGVPNVPHPAPSKREQRK